MLYRHTQVNYIGFVAFAALALVFLAAVVGAPQTNMAAVIGFTAFFLMLGAVLLNFSRLTVTVDTEVITAAFGRGWPQREIQVDKVVSTNQVRNRWLDGFGVRSTNNGPLYNVWGLEAVQLRLDDNTLFQIGTDQPDVLQAAIDQARATPGHTTEG